MADPNFVTTSTGIAAIAAGSSFAAGLLGAFISSATMRATHRQRIDADKDLAERKFDFDRQLAARKAEVDAALADKKLMLDRAFVAWKRRSELAEQALIRFNEVQKVFQWVRTPGSISGDEGKSRSPEGSEDERLKRQRDNFFIPIERLQREKELFSALQTLRPAFEAHFGLQGGMPFNEIVSIYTAITSAAFTLIEVAKFAPPPSPFGDGQPANAPLLNTIGWGPSARPDELDHRIDAAVEAMRALCEPVLAWKPET